MSQEISIKQDRVASIDVLRGFAMFLILSTQIGGAPIFKTFVNLLGPDVVAVTAHQFSWTVPGVNLMNVAQSIFIFVVGLVLPFSLGKRLAQTGKRKTYLHIVRRSLILFVLGTIAGGHLLDFKLETFYFYNNVLEYISIGYLVCSLLVLNTSQRTQWFVTVGILLLVWAIWGLIPAPGWEGDRFSTEMNIDLSRPAVAGAARASFQGVDRKSEHHQPDREHDAGGADGAHHFQSQRENGQMQDALRLRLWNVADRLAVEFCLSVIAQVHDQFLRA